MEKPEVAARVVGPIHDRIGPIVDPAFLKILSEQQMKEVVVTLAKAEHENVVAQAQALQKVITALEGMKVG
jgi:hypothetical protein